MTGTLFGVEFLGDVFLFVFHFLFVLGSWVVCLAIWYSARVIYFIHSRIYISSHLSVHAFYFLYIENTKKKKGILHWLVFLSWNLYH
jgi:hypothetical protein